MKPNNSHEPLIRTGPDGRDFWTGERIDDAFDLIALVVFGVIAAIAVAVIA